MFEQDVADDLHAWDVVTRESNKAGIDWAWDGSGATGDDSCGYARDGEVSGQRSIVLCLRSSTGHQIRVQPLSELYVAAAV